MVSCSSANNSGHPTVGLKQQTAVTRPLQLPDISSSHDSASEDTPATQSSAPHVAPQQGTTDGTENETKRTEVLDHQSGNEVLEEADTGKECSPPHSVDIFDGKNGPMNRAMDWCGWSTSSFERSPVGCRCGWRAKCGRSSDVEIRGVQTEIFSHILRAQAIRIAPIC